VATGHYARVGYDQQTGRYRLFRGRNAAKDQSYFLWELTQTQLSRALFPLGEMSKPEAREAARSHGLAVAEKAESQEICFVPDGDYAGFIDRYLLAQEDAETTPEVGEIVDSSGKVLGKHLGIHHFTVGQRRGLRIAAERPLYVLSIDATRNQVIVGEQEELRETSFIATGVNWVAFEAPASPVRAQVRIRYRHAEAPATVIPLGPGQVRVEFDEAQRAITPGQATVFYREDEVLGGGWIVKESRVLATQQDFSS
jgi:tRNA-specific 2-thiouridylase